ncbi:hypothetical protein Mapa_005794 [Marchantia paleacea]|nr:hypothetical protein Mapa_005794 [Marchantia paleacea]
MHAHRGGIGQHHPRGRRQTCQFCQWNGRGSAGCCKLLGPLEIPVGNDHRCTPHLGPEGQSLPSSSCTDHHEGFASQRRALTAGHPTSPKTILDSAQSPITVSVIAHKFAIAFPHQSVHGTDVLGQRIHFIGQLYGVFLEGNCHAKPCKVRCIEHLQKCCEIIHQQRHVHGIVPGFSEGRIVQKRALAVPHGIADDSIHFGVGVNLLDSVDFDQISQSRLPGSAFLSRGKSSEGQIASELGSENSTDQSLGPHDQRYGGNLRPGLQLQHSANIGDMLSCCDELHYVGTCSYHLRSQSSELVFRWGEIVVVVGHDELRGGLLRFALSSGDELRGALELDVDVIGSEIGRQVQGLEAGTFVADVLAPLPGRPVGDDGGESPGVEESREIGLRVEALNVVDPQLNQICSRRFGLANLRNHVVHGLGHQRRAHQTSVRHFLLPCSPQTLLSYGRRRDDLSHTP